MTRSGRRVFVAGGTGVIGRRLVTLLVGEGHVVAGMTRSAAGADLVRTLGGEPVVADVYDPGRVIEAVRAFAPDLVVHQLTDLPDDVRDLAASRAANARIRREGTRTLVEAAAAVGAGLAAQSVAWTPEGDGGRAVAEMEEAVLAVDGVVLRYGQLYGPGTFHEGEPPPAPRVHVDEAARRTVPALELRGTTVTIVED
jgi:nucleoside-diphosphate-sugar epimerase